MIRRALAALTLALGMSGCSSSAGPTGVATPMDAATLFATIATLSASRPFTAAAVSRATGAKLSDTPQSNPYFKVLRGTKGAAGPFDLVEVREPTAQSTGQAGMVLLELSEPCVKRADVGDRFGQAAPSTPAPPNPHMPPDSPEYEVYPQSWGAIKLGFKPSTGCLVSVVIDGVK